MDNATEKENGVTRSITLNLNQTTQLVLPSTDNEISSPKLSEPRHLFSLQRELGPQQAPRWPAECQMAVATPKHILKCLSEREPYYQATGTEPEPSPWGDEVLKSGGDLVYCYIPESTAPYFTRSSTANGLAPADDNRFLVPDDSLIFESRFESGNLSKVFRITGNFYELHLRPDLYTSRHLQWFYFSIKNMQARTTYRFSIVNFAKADSLYLEGMKPLMYSEKRADAEGIGWTRCGTRIAYYRNDNVEGTNPTHTLSFTLEFPHSDDTVYLAYCYPYTYSYLQDRLLFIQNDEERAQYCKIRLLCRSLAGNSVHVLTITSPSTEDSEKSGIVLTARVHPGETPSSWIMDGVLDFLTGPSACAQELREKFIFKIIPMLNPDGVIVGNTRCSLAARDLNRQYRVVSRECYPSVWHVKMLIRKLMEERPVAFYCDFHSHSRKHNVFIYGCEDKDLNDLPLIEQVFPLMMHKASNGKFDFENCKFVVQRAKEGTGRVVMKQLGVQYSYTLEASVCGTLTGSDSSLVQTHFSIQDYQEIGHVFCETLANFFNPIPTRVHWIERALRYLSNAGSTAEEPIYVRVPDDDSPEEENAKRCFQSRRFSLLVNGSHKKTDFLQVARCISQLNVQMSRLNCGPRSRSNSFSPSPSRSPSLKSYLSASASPRSGPSPTISSSRIKPKDLPQRRRPKKLIRSLTLPSVDNALPVTVSFPSSSESEDKTTSSAKVSSPKVKNQILVDFQAKTASVNGIFLRTHLPSAINGRNVPTINRPDSLRGMQKKVPEPGLKGAKPKAQFTLQVVKDVNRLKSLSDSPPGTAQKTKQSQTTTTLPKKKSKKKHAKNLNANVKTELYRVGALSRVLNAMKK
ncbi:cytosolic carboxypeptidase 2-like isoform X2 [Daphnia pulex]|uniref:cytosolic carboxypeptidase 2-like isoform X2 n=1 Tax=Daphnia pulex TaxID=6669 RepID=UPI001EDDE72D|nr:cytosolic carboxypeptidase 2-like isoform X2 [Daphnia pulex]